VTISSAAAEELPGTPIKGPSALGDDPRRFLRLTWTLAITQFKLKFYGSVLGYLWQLMRPLMLFGVLYVVFTEFVRLGNDVEFYPVVLLTGIVLYTFVSEATSGAVASVVERETLVRKVHFPRMVIPCAVVLTAFLNLMLNLLAVAVFAAISGVPLHGSAIQIPVILLALVAFVLGIALVVSALYVRYRDVQPIWEVLLQVLFYGTPVLYPIEVVPVGVREWMVLNPFAAVVQQMRHAVIDPTAQSAPIVAGGWDRLTLSGLVVAAFFVIGFLIFHREAPRIAEEL